MLKRIATRDVEPADLDVALAPRLNLLAGDNGLGKTFLLDLAWWALTGTWARSPALPRQGDGRRPMIAWTALDQERRHDAQSDFGLPSQAWSWSWGKPENLVLYSRPEGGFEIFDPLRSSRPWPRGS